MAAFYSFFVVLALVVLAWVGAGEAGGKGLFGITSRIWPFWCSSWGFLSKILGWAKRPVPFCIPTTGGSRSRFHGSEQSIGKPHNASGTVIRMAFEVMTFRSLFRNTSLCLKQEGPGRIQLGQVAVAFRPHVPLFFLFILLRHPRLFLYPVPMPLEKLEFVDSIHADRRAASVPCGHAIVAALLIFVPAAGCSIPRST
jgi:nitrate reductase gamma subunit